MYKNQLQELAQRSCFNLPSYTCMREGPDHAPRFKVTVNFNGETFESPSFCSTIRQAEYSAAEVALDALINRGPSNSLTARILDETGVYKNLLQEVSQRVGSSLPVYKTTRSGLGHMPVFNCVVEFAGVRFTGQQAKNKKQAEKNAAMAAWTSLKQLPQPSERISKKANSDEQEHVAVARALHMFLRKAKMDRIQFPIIFPAENPKPSSTEPTPARASKILPLIFPNSAPQSSRISTNAHNNSLLNKNKPFFRPASFPRAQQSMENQRNRQFQNFPVIAAPSDIPLRHFMTNSHHGIVPPVTVRNTIPVFSPPPMPRWYSATPPPPPLTYLRRAVPVFSAPPVQMEQHYPVVDNGEGRMGNGKGYPAFANGEGRMGNGKGYPVVVNGEGRMGNGKNYPVVTNGEGRMGNNKGYPFVSNGEGRRMGNDKGKKKMETSSVRQKFQGMKI